MGVFNLALVNGVSSLIKNGKSTSERELALAILDYVRREQRSDSSLRNEIAAALGGKSFKMQASAYKIAPKIGVKAEQIIAFINGDDKAMNSKEINQLITIIEEKNSIL